VHQRERTIEVARVERLVGTPQEVALIVVRQR